MRGKSSSSSKTKNGILEAENKLENLSESHVSSAYIRSLVKQLSSSRTKDSSSKGQETSGEQVISCDGLFSDQEKPHNLHQQQPTPQQHKKQVRRRLHTSRPYQERLLNMAEARREIVTALKFHRASMKKAREEQQQHQDQKPESGHGNQPFEPPPDHNCIEQDAKSKSRRNPRIYASNSLISSDPPTNYSDNFSYSPGIYASYSWSVPHIPPPPLYQENLNFTLPSQTLGLNLNLQDFNNLDASAFNCSNNPSSIYSSSSSASTSSSPLNWGNTEEAIPCIGAQSPVLAELENPGLHHAIDDKEMAALRSIGEQYQMEWNDTMSLVNSAWWFKFLKAMEVENTEDKKGGDELLNSPFYDEVMEFPAWINANDESCVNDFCCYDYFQDPTTTLPCMDIEEIEGMDGDWLA